MFTFSIAILLSVLLQGILTHREGSGWAELRVSPDSKFAVITVDKAPADGSVDHGLLLELTGAAPPEPFKAQVSFVADLKASVAMTIDVGTPKSRKVAFAIPSVAGSFKGMTVTIVSAVTGFTTRYPGFSHEAMAESIFLKAPRRKP